MDTALWDRALELSRLRLRYWYAWQLMKPHVKAMGGTLLQKVEGYKAKSAGHLRDAQQKLDLMIHQAQGWDILPKVPEDLERGFEADLTEAAAAILKLEGKAGEISGAW